MKRLLALAVMVCAAACAHGQSTDTTVCAVLKNPKAFDGKMVRIQGTVVTGLDQFVLEDGSCGKQVNSIWLAYPPGAKTKSGPLALLELQPAHNFAGPFKAVTRPAVTLQKDKAFKQFDSALAQEHHSPAALCIACPKYDVQATITGRLDGVDDAALRRENGKIVGLGGFGSANAYPARLVIQSVTDVAPREIDYSKADAKEQKTQWTPQQQPTQPPSYSDPLTTLQKIAGMLAPSPMTTRIQKDVALLSTPKEETGVVVGYGDMDEAEAESLSAEDSPDGVQYHCTFNRGKLQDESMGMAMLFLAQQISDIRNPAPSNEDASLYTQENDAWAVSSTLVLAVEDKYLILPGGYLMWDASWPKADRLNNMVGALNDFLSKEKLLSK